MNSPTNTNENTVISKKEDLNILEWKFSQFLGEKMNKEEMIEEENKSYIISSMKMSENNYLIIGDRGGRIILFKKDKNLLTYFYEFNAYDRDFDVNKSTEYCEKINSICPISSVLDDKIDILSCSYRTIKLHRVYNAKINNFKYEKGLNVPVIINSCNETNFKLKKNILIPNGSDLNSISYNNFMNNMILTSDDTKAILLDLNYKEQAYGIIEFYNNIFEDSPIELITTSKINKFNHNLFAIGTSHGNIKLCDFRTNSDYLKYSTNYIDEFNNIIKSGFNLSKTTFSYQIMSVHDMDFIDDNRFVTRHYLSINIWDRRINNTPLSRFLIYEPIIPKLSHLYRNNYLSIDKFELSISSDKKYILTGGYNNMFHVFDINQRLNTQCVIDDSNEKILNMNIIRKINTKGSCYYKRDDPSYDKIDFDSRILRNCFSNNENMIFLANQNCIFTYNGNMIIKENKK